MHLASLHFAAAGAAVALSVIPLRADITVTVTVDPEAGHMPISPYIYGSNQDIPNAPLTVMRQGGNRMTGYNWENNASNAGADWFHQSDNFLTWVSGIPGAEENTPGIVVTKFHDDAQARGAGYSLVTLQLAGYVARDKNGTTVAEAEAAPSSRWVPVSFIKPTAYSTNPDATDNAVYMDEFVDFLVSRYGSASTPTGVRGYCLDNEPDLWAHTHARIHPAAPGCAELVSLNVDGAKAIKRVDPAAETFGFVSYGFTGYLSYQDAPDWPTERTKGSYRWFVDYYLDQMKKASDTAGMRLLDAIDLHNYSEATGGGERVNNPSTWGNADCNRARMQAPRSYWDDTYTENSWIGQWFSDYLPLLPNVQSSIDAFYPGTKLAITEYNFGGESHISGGIAEADSLGIFGREGVYLATWWQLHDDPTYIAAAFRLFLDYDGTGSMFGDVSVGASASDRATCSAYAAVDTSNPNRLHLILLNKSDTQPAVLSIQIAGASQYTSARVFAFDSTSPTISERTGVASIAGNQFNYTLPALTAAHVVLNTAAGVGPTITAQPTSTASTAGGSTSLAVSATGAGTLGYQWRIGGAAIAGATGATYTIPSVQAFHAGDYSVAVTDATGTTVSDTVTITVTPAPASNARLMNLSTRALDLTGDGIMIPGFVISGTGTKRMLIRGVGPGLFATFGLGGTLADPQISIVSEGSLLATNDDWGSAASDPEMVSTAAAVGAFALDDDSKDAALLIDLPAGAYTVPTAGVNNGTGIALVELYDADALSPSAKLVNISNRGFVDVGDNIMIPGFVVSSEGSRTFLIRAIGPGLNATFGLTGVLADPVLTVFRGSEAILSIDDWDAGPGAADTATTAGIVGAFPLAVGSADAAFVVTLPPGAYTAQATGRNGGTGVALVEVYLVP